MTDIKSALKTIDITYIRDGMFTTFMPDSKEGVTVYKDLIEQNNGSDKVFNSHSKNVIKQIRSAGYIVKKAPKSTITLEDCFKEMEELGI